MPKSVETLKILIEEEKKLKEKYISALEVMGHNSSKTTLQNIITEKNNAIELLEKTLKNSDNCPGVNAKAKKCCS